MIAECYLKLLLDFPAAWADRISERLAASGCLGIEETDAPAPDRDRWVVYFPADAGGVEIVERVRADLASLGACSPHGPAPFAVSAEIVPAYDWAGDVRRSFRAMEISPRLAVAPSWERDYVLPGGVVIRLDPAQAFGTGRHETTRICLLALEEILDRADDPRRLRALDVGCGSGILAIYAALRGVARVTALDLDPLAVEMAGANAAANGVAEAVRVLAHGPERLAGSFDLVVANLQCEPLLALGEAIRRAVAPGGRLILSGLLVGEDDEVRRAYVEAGLIAEGDRRMGEWVGLILKANP